MPGEKEETNSSAKRVIRSEYIKKRQTTFGVFACLLLVAVYLDYFFIPFILFLALFIWCTMSFSSEGAKQDVLIIFWSKGDELKCVLCVAFLWRHWPGILFIARTHLVDRQF